MASINDKHLSPASTLLKENSDFRRAQTFIQGAFNHGRFHRDKNRHHHSNHHIKENTEHSSPLHSSSRNKKSLEILDFHESWREEMEVYRHLFGKRDHPHSRKSVNEVNKDTKEEERRKLPRNIASIDTSAIKAVVNRKVNMTKSKKKNNEKHKVRVGATLAGLDSTKEKLASNQNDLKRRREESPVKVSHRNANANGTSRRPITNVRSPQTYSRKSTPTPVLTPKAIANTNNGIINLNSHHTSGSTTSPNKSNMKIIVNQFHASSILNGHEFEEKAKILTQNGLHKTNTAAYEASFYAANYLASGVRHDHMHIRHHNMGDYSNYVGVSMAKYGHDARNRIVDDDPCAAIDDVNTYTDTDSEEEYTGEPFFLEEDTDQQLQSKNIRYQDSIKSETECTENTEKTQQSDYYQPSSILTPSQFPNVPPYLNFSSHAAKGPNIPTALHKVLKWKLSPVMPKIVKRVVLNSGFRIIKNTTDWMAIWEKHMKSPGFRTIRSHQKYNHMPGSFRIGRKDTMWRSIYQNMKKYGTKEFGFMQRSYIMPEDLESLRQSWPKNASRLTKWIVKPPASARGTGIRIVNKWSQFPKDRPLVVQKYIERPLLINDNKFDMRIYVVLTSINPIRIYLYKDGLARFASVKYSSELNSLDERCMHLTNYSINKLSQNYAKNEDFNACQGHKWTLQSLWSCLEARGVNTKRLWATLRNLVIKAIISGEAGLNRMYRQNVNFRYNCFEMFGFDVLLDENLIPWLLEINISPSLHSELPLDLHVKGPLIQAVLNTALYQVPPKLTEKQQKEILEELKIKAPLCHDKRIFTTCLTAEEIRKHNQFTNRAIEYRAEYLDAILENLLPDDVRCLIVTEDEFARCQPLERIFPTPESHAYLKFIENPRYYNRLLDAWENRYGQCREQGIKLLSKLCEENYHLNVSDAAMENEPDITLTEIDLLHVKKIDDVSGKIMDGVNLIVPPKSSDTDVPSTNSSVHVPEKESNGQGQGDHFTAQPKKTPEDAPK